LREVFKGAETQQDEWVVLFAFFGRFEPFMAVRTYEKGLKFFEGVYRGRGLTLGVGHLVWPPGYVFERHWMKNNALSSLLIMIVDVHHMYLCQVILFVDRLVLV
jgi:hypothetical protein